MGLSPDRMQPGRQVHARPTGSSSTGVYTQQCNGTWGTASSEAAVAAGPRFRPSSAKIQRFGHDGRSRECSQDPQATWVPSTKGLPSRAVATSWLPGPGAGCGIAQLVGQHEQQDRVGDLWQGAPEACRPGHRGALGCEGRAAVAPATMTAIIRTSITLGSGTRSTHPRPKPRLRRFQRSGRVPRSHQMPSPHRARPWCRAEAIETWCTWKCGRVAGRSRRGARSGRPHRRRQGSPGQTRRTCHRPWSSDTPR